MENREVELKLETDLAGIDVLAHASILALVDVEEQEQTSTYFDTPEQDIRKAGLSLRIRKIGTKRIQTVKAESKAMAGLFARPEWEIAIRQDTPRNMGTPLKGANGEAGIGKMRSLGLEPKTPALKVPCSTN